MTSETEISPKDINLATYLDGMRAATTAVELEAAIQTPFKHAYRGRTWSQICTVREEVGRAICDAHPNGHFVPRFGPRRQLIVCGETYKVGRGQNSTGVRYVWHYAGKWAKTILLREGFSIRASHRIWEDWRDYPHRCLSIVEKALAGEIPDPELNVLRPHGRTDGSPIRYSIEQNDADKGDQRATRPCPCGGTLFDWGAGHSEGFDFVNWHCNVCPEIFTEYFGPGGLVALRNPTRKAA